ncbi:COPINE FAMILY PROTEIN 1 [Salix viminalis]|uniref:COPINE FAMILY PROTEIN 1 n=1 Tax=Salix viminalis TaxID=40686 RepID=A0A9Q0V3D1_SALVM|nr:COPINE FAMILY PROTEIN 1 [Salix viminalis]
MGSKNSRNQDHHHRDSHGCRVSSNPSSSPNADGRSKLQSKYSKFDDDYNSLEQVTKALKQAGLESSNLIVGIDFTKSNEWTGERSFHGESLHHLGDSMNPYEQAISIIGKTLPAFDEDNLIPCFGFGDATTHDQKVFSFYPDDRVCNGFEQVLSRYREIVPCVNLAGPTSFAPIIETAIEIVNSSGGQYHVLLIIADGQVTRSGETVNGRLSPQEQNTINAIVNASNYPLSIVLVGVGDGPWDMMHKFDDNIPSRAFDNFQFVNFTEIMSKHILMSKKEAEFALEALMEIPSPIQGYNRPPTPRVIKMSINMQLNTRKCAVVTSLLLPSTFSCRKGAPGRNALPPPLGKGSVNSYPTSSRPRSNVAHVPSTDHSSHGRRCPSCSWKKKDLAFGCGHQTCYDCGKDLAQCPVCQTYVTTKIKLYE